MSLQQHESQDASVADNARPMVPAGHRPRGGVGVSFVHGPPGFRPLLQQRTVTPSGPTALYTIIAGHLLLVAALLALAFFAQAAPAPPGQAQGSLRTPPFSPALCAADRTPGSWRAGQASPLIPPAGAFTRLSTCRPHTSAPQTDQALACWDDETTAPVGIFSQVSLVLGPDCGIQAVTLLAGSGSSDFPEATPRSPPSRT